MTPSLFAPGPPLRPVRRLLVANRGEIAVRIIRACRDEGIAAVAAYADADRDALWVRMADDAYALHGDRPADTYLDGSRLIAIARRSGADAVHPGYGFLSENAGFARAVQDAGLLWIGPDPAVIDTLGDKAAARRIAQAVGAPLAAGSDGPVANAAEARAFAEAHGLPIVIKAAHGGGGRGMKIARRPDEIADLFDAARREAQAAFGRNECFVERYLDRPRHLEVQVLADRHGTVKVLGTRDCSLQRRHGKLVEEAPAPFLTDDRRAALCDAARAVCAHAGYSGAGTVEFLLAADGTLSFLEVNTRLQVEHPVTEETTGIDIVRASIAIAAGARLADATMPALRGHAIEFRINAEDPARGFLPTPGPVAVWEVPGGPGIRIDSGVAAGSVVPAAFDGLMAKLVVWGATRPEALARAARALAEFRIEGVASTLPFHRAVLDDPAFRATNGILGVHTRWIETEFAPRLDAMAAHARVTPVPSAPLRRVGIEIDGRRVQLGLPPGLLAAAPAEAARADDLAVLTAPVAGLLQDWLVPDGATVAEGQPIAVIEAMKTETRIAAHRAGRLQRLAATGAPVAFGEPLARVLPEGAAATP